MNDKIDYRSQTLDAYKTSTRAIEYQKYNSRNWTWGRFITWLEQRIVRQELKAYEWRNGDCLLDIPCGTGILGPTIKGFPFDVTASDISCEMMNLAKSEYTQKYPLQFIQSDITDTSFEKNSYPCIITLGFFHRVPEEIKESTLKELHRISSNVVIISFSADSFFQRAKRRILALLYGKKISAPCPESIERMKNRVKCHGFKVVRMRYVFPLFSSDVLVVLEKC